MSAGGAFGGNRGARPVPPEKGVFPLDHMHLCDLEKKDYLSCLKSSGHASERCRQFSKKYLECRMEKNLMAKQDMSELGFGKEGDAESVAGKSDGRNHKLSFFLPLSGSFIFMTSNLSLGSSNFSHLQDSALSGRKLYLKPNLFPSKIDVKEQDKNWQVKNGFPKQFLFMNSLTFQTFSSKWIPPGALLYLSASDWECENCKLEDVGVMNRSFSVEIRRLEWVRTGPPAAMAWTGLDLHSWHKHIAYQVAAYALLKAGIRVQFFLSDSSCHSTSKVHKILSPVRKFLRDHTKKQPPKFGRVVSNGGASPGTFLSLFRSGPLKTLEGITIAITCCAAVQKVGRKRVLLKG